jgi:hypothetical protein
MVREKKKGLGWEVPETAINFYNKQTWFFRLIILQIVHYIVTIYFNLWPMQDILSVLHLKVENHWLIGNGDYQMLMIKTVLRLEDFFLFCTTQIYILSFYSVAITAQCIPTHSVLGYLNPVYRYLVVLLGWQISLSQSLCLHRTTQTQKKTQTYIHALSGTQNHDPSVWTVRTVWHTNIYP